MPGPSRPYQPSEQDQFVRGLAAATGLDQKVIAAWVQVEGSYERGGTGGHNYLNLRAPGATGYSGVPIPSTSSGGFAQFGSVSDAIQETAYWINHMPNYATIRSSTHLGPRSQIAAISASPWDAGHYNGGRSLYNAYASLVGAAGAGADWLGRIGRAIIDAGTGDPIAVPGDLTGGAGKIPVVGGLLTAAEAPVKIAQGFGTVVGEISNSENWLRGGYIIGGGLMVLLGAVLLAKSVGALNITTPAAPTVDLGGGKPGDGRGPMASQSRTAQRRAGFSLNLPNQGRRPRPKPGAPGSTKLAPGDTIPY